MEELYVKKSNGQRIIESSGTAPLAFPNRLKRPGYSAWSKEPTGSSKGQGSSHHITTSSTPAQLYRHRTIVSRSRWGTRPWTAWYAMEFQKGLPADYTDKLNIPNKWWGIPDPYAPELPPSRKAE